MITGNSPRHDCGNGLVLDQIDLKGLDIIYDGNGAENKYLRQISFRNVYGCSNIGLSRVKQVLLVEEISR